MKAPLLIVAAATLLLAACSGVKGPAFSHFQSASDSGQTGLSAAATGGEHESALIHSALSWLETRYYKPIDNANVVKSERAEMLAYLKHEHIANPRIAIAPSSEDTYSALLDQLAHAQSRYAKKLGAKGHEDLFQSAISGVMDAQHDPYTVYLPRRDFQGLTELINGGDFSGIGVYIYALKDGDVLLQPIEGLPAAKAGMGIAEIVKQVDHVRVHGLPLDRVEGMIRGPVGSKVELVTKTLAKKPRIRSYTIVREIIHVPTVYSHMMGKYDYIRLADFGETSATEVRKALLAGLKQHARGFIFDLRDNGGGLVDAAVKISSFFIPQGTIVSTVFRDGHSEVQEANGTAIGGLRPLVVLVNKYSASASEITTGALQDYHRATVIGTKTFGKGVVQQIFPLGDGSAVKITIARYLTPKGRSIQHRGLIPDILVNQNARLPLGGANDKQLNAAISLLNHRKSKV